MSIRHGLLALLAQGPRHGYQLRSEFESVTGGTWSLNVGQVYSTLSRLGRDGLVEELGKNTEGRHVYRLTDKGEQEMRHWFATPLVQQDRPRNELAIKLAMAITTPGVDVEQVVQAQRAATLRTLQDLTRLKADSATPVSDPDEQAWRLVLEAMIFQTEAEFRWLDHCEAYVTRVAASGADTGDAGDRHGIAVDTGGDTAALETGASEKEEPA